MAQAIVTNISQSADVAAAAADVADVAVDAGVGTVMGID